MRRRRFLTLAAGALVSLPHPSRAQTAAKIPRVGYLFSFAPAEGAHLWEACRLGLRELGYVEGGNVQLLPRWADGHHERLPALVDELVRERVDVIVAAATPANLAAQKRVGGGLPVVMVAVADPVRVGLVASYARPGTNFTGLSLLTPELSGKRLELVLELLQRPIRSVAVVSNPDNPSHAIFLEETEAAGRQVRISVIPLNARNPAEIGQAFAAAARAGADALIVFDDPVTWSHRAHVVSTARDRRIPVVYGYSEYVTGGGLISYGPHRPDLYRRTADYVDRLLKGAEPATLPIERPTRFELVVNVGTAKALGLSVPASLLARADNVIE